MEWQWHPDTDIIFQIEDPNEPKPSWVTHGSLNVAKRFSYSFRFSLLNPCLLSIYGGFIQRIFGRLETFRGFWLPGLSTINFSGATVGRNPAPVNIEHIAFSMGFHTKTGGAGRFFPSIVYYFQIPPCYSLQLRLTFLPLLQPTKKLPEVLH